MSSNEVFDVIVIGGGPAGMMAAGTAALRDKRVLLVEKNPKLGAKLSITGGGRCNILNAEEDERTLLSHYGKAAPFLYSPFSQHGMRDSWIFFTSRGLPIVIEENKRAFPASQRAIDVTELLRGYCTNANVVLALGTSVSSFIERQGAIVGVKTSSGDYFGKQCILATGGSARGETGSSGEGILWLAKYGHTVHPSNPNIVPLKVLESWIKDNAGVTVNSVKITFGSNVTKAEGQFSVTGRVLLTHFGISGPTVLNSAHRVKSLLKSGGSLPAHFDCFPSEELGAVRARLLAVFEENKNKTFKNVLKDCVPPGMAPVVVAQISSVLLEKKVHSVTQEERYWIADLLKHMPFTVTGTMGLDWAVISDGGVDLTEVDTRTMRSRKIPNLFLVGDTLHVNRPSGGYSLQLCWTTGWVAGISV